MPTNNENAKCTLYVLPHRSLRPRKCLVFISVSANRNSFDEDDLVGVNPIRQKVEKIAMNLV